MILRQTYLRIPKGISHNNTRRNIPNLGGLVRSSHNASAQNSGKDSEIISHQEKRCSSRLPSGLILRHALANQQHILAPRHNHLFRHECGFHCTQNINALGNNQPQDDDKKNPGIVARFKNAYKEYGYTMIAVHAVTSVMWYGSFVAAAHSGIDVIPLLEYFGTSQSIITKITSSGADSFVAGYIMYKLMTPVRYAVTLGCTQLTVKQLRKRGYIKTPSEEDSLRNLAKDGRSKAKEKMHENKEKLKHTVDDVPEKMKHHMEEGMDKMKHRFEDTGEKIKDRVGKHEGISKMRHRLEDANEQINKELGKSFDRYFGEKSDEYRERFRAQSKITKENLRQKTKFSKSKLSEDIEEIKEIFMGDSSKKGTEEGSIEKISKNKKGKGGK